jgi:hypothetical protein
MIQSCVFPVRFDSKRIRGPEGETRGNPPFTSGGALVCAPTLGARAAKRAARRKESRGIVDC